MAEISVYRGNEMTFSLVTYKVFLNEKLIDKIDSGTKVVIDVQPGSYELKIVGKFFLSSNSLIFNIESSDQKVFLVTSFKNGLFKYFLKLKQVD